MATGTFHLEEKESLTLESQCIISFKDSKNITRFCVGRVEQINIPPVGSGEVHSISAQITGDIGFANDGEFIEKKTVENEPPIFEYCVHPITPSVTKLLHMVVRLQAENDELESRLRLSVDSSRLALDALSKEFTRIPK